MTEHIYRDPDWLRDRYWNRHMTMEAMAAEAGCLPESIFHWLRKYSIPTRSRADALRKRIRRECSYCHAELLIKPSRAKRSVDVYCAASCFRAHQKETNLPAAEKAKRVEARRLMNTAVTAGKLTKSTSCDRCGSSPRRIEGHHHDYDRPFDVEWLCRPCHVIADREPLVGTGY